MTETVVSLTLLGKPREVRAEELEPAVSRLTENELERIHISVTVQGEDTHDRLIAELNAAKGESPGLVDSNGEHWRPIQNSYSYTQRANATTYTHNVQLEKIEDLTLSAVEFGDIHLVPDRWRFDTEGKQLAAVIMATVDSTQNEKLESFLLERPSKAETPYFPVKLIGVGDSARSMRFGQCLWQRMSDGCVRHRLVLVSEEGDEDTGFHGFNEPEVSRLEDAAINTAAKLETLIRELHQAGIIDADSVSRIDSIEPPKNAYREFDRALDVDTFFD